MSRSRRPRVVNGPLIKPREPGRLADLARVVLLGALVALPAFLYATLQANLHNYRRSVVQLERQLEEIEERRRRLEVELASLRDPRRIKDLATNMSQLVPVQPDQIVYLSWPPIAANSQPDLVAEALGDPHGRQRP
jgi:cell division protein FtsB